MSLSKRLNAIFYGATDVGDEVHCPVRVETKIFPPPSYMVRLVLREGGFTEYGPMDKIAWSYFLRYKGFDFEVRDWKNTTWTIEVD